MAFFMGILEVASLRYLTTDLSVKCPALGIDRAELGQQTASGISFMGVALIPAWPLLRITPEKNMPITALSIVISWIISFKLFLT